MKIRSYLQKLIRYPHPAVFNKDPLPGIAFHMHAPGGVQWRVLDEVMTVEHGGNTVVYDLQAIPTVSALIDLLRDDGIEVERPSAYFYGRTPRVLLDGAGDTGTPGGDVVLGFQSLLWATYAAYASELRLAKAQVSEALKQMIITQAEGEWLQVWGSMFGVPPIDGEPDSSYQQRIPDEAFRLRVNGLAIEQAVYDLTGHHIFIRETWPDLFRLDASRLSGTHRLPDNDQWRYGYIQPLSNQLIDWSAVLPIIQRNKAAGVIVLPPSMQVGQLIDARVDGAIYLGHLHEFGAWVRQIHEFRLDVLRLDTTAPHRNWSPGVDVEHGITNIIRGGTWADVGPGWPDQPWNHGNRVDDLDGTVWSSVAEDMQGQLVLYGTPAFRVEGAAATTDSDGTVNINTWATAGTWETGTWQSLGSPLPYSVAGLMETDTL